MLLMGAAVVRFANKFLKAFQDEKNFSSALCLFATMAVRLVILYFRVIKRYVLFCI